MNYVELNRLLGVTKHFNSWAAGPNPHTLTKQTPHDQMPVVGDERLQEPHRHVDPEAQRYKPLPTAGLMDPDSSRYQHGFE